MSNIIGWVDPPDNIDMPGRWTPNWAPIATELRHNPNHWALVTIAPSYWHHRLIDTANLINKNGVAKLRCFGRFEAATRLLTPQTTGIYMRYRGDLT